MLSNGRVHFFRILFRKCCYKSILIHSDYQGVHFCKSLLSCLFVITEYLGAKLITNYKNPFNVTYPRWQTTNFYKVSPDLYNDLMQQNINKDYKKT